MGFFKKKNGIIVSGMKTWLLGVRLWYILNVFEKNAEEEGAQTGRRSLGFCRKTVAVRYGMVKKVFRDGENIA